MQVELSIEELELRIARLQETAEVLKADAERSGPLNKHAGKLYEINALVDEYEAMRDDSVRGSTNWKKPRRRRRQPMQPNTEQTFYAIDTPHECIMLADYHVVRARESANPPAMMSSAESSLRDAKSAMLRGDLRAAIEWSRRSVTYATHAFHPDVYAISHFLKRFRLQRPVKYITRAQREALLRKAQREDVKASYRDLRRRLQPTMAHDGCVMLHLHNMWIGIEADGYTHS